MGITSNSKYMDDIDRETDKTVYSYKDKISAWMVHFFTMSGVAWASLAILALYRGQIKLMWLWLLIAMFVDGIDGFFARKFKVKEVIPSFDGSILDMVVDYLTWTFIPALFMYFYIPFAPDYSNQWLPLTMFIVVGISSVFCYCNTNMKADDYYFVGFPAAWNIVAVYLYIFQTNWIFNICLTILLVLLTPSKIKFVHPFRVKKFLWINMLMAFLWLLSLSLLIAEINKISLLLEVMTLYIINFAIYATLICSTCWFIFISVLRTIRGV